MNATLNGSPKTSPAFFETADHVRSRVITVAIKQAERDLRRRWPILKYQSAIGAGSFLVCALGTLFSSWMYIQGLIPWWICLLVNAFFLSLIREIEHDLIHNLYFRTRLWIQNLMMLAVWPFLGNLPHPWYRRRMHLLHHRTSGQVEDFEERLIGNGMKFGPLKILAMIEPGLASLFRHKEFEEIPFYNRHEFFKALFPVATFYLVIWYSWLVGGVGAVVANVLGVGLPGWAEAILAPLHTIAVVFILPNLLRQVCLQIISSNMHYFGDVESRLQETQVMNAWWLLPLQLFTCNFGSTHTIHHFVVNQPFYVRQLIAHKAHAAFLEYGVRFNDAETILRANRYHGDRVAGASVMKQTG